MADFVMAPPGAYYAEFTWLGRDGGQRERREAIVAFDSEGTPMVLDDGRLVTATVFRTKNCLPLASSKVEMVCWPSREVEERVEQRYNDDEAEGTHAAEAPNAGGPFVEVPARRRATRTS